MPDLPTASTIHVYRRVSVDDKKTGSCSLDWQRDTVTAWLNAHGWVADGEYEDNGVSASIDLDERPSGGLLVADAVHRGDMIVVAKFDRIFRDVEDFRARLRVWADMGVQLVCVQEGLDLTTPTGRMIATMIVAVAEWERETIGGRIAAAVATRKEHGLRYTSEARYGWRHEPFGPARANGSQECRLVEYEDEQVVIEQIVQMRDATLSLREIAAVLSRIGHPTRSGRDWRHSTVADILKDLDHHRGQLPDWWEKDMSWPVVRKAIADKRGPKK